MGVLHSRPSHSRLSLVVEVNLRNVFDESDCEFDVGEILDEEEPTQFSSGTHDRNCKDAHPHSGSDHNRQQAKFVLPSLIFRKVSFYRIHLVCLCVTS